MCDFYGLKFNLYIFMTILQINVTCGHGSTGVIAVEIANVLRSQGHNCYIAYGQGTTSYDKSYKIGGKIENKLHGLINTRVLGQEGTGTLSGTRKFIKWIDSINPDIIHIHTLHSNFLNYKIFFNYLRDRKIPVVWSFFDCWPFTGKCTHFVANGCRNWEVDKGCKGHCPQLYSSGSKTWFFDKTAKMYSLKKQWFQALDSLDIIVCSNWLKSEVEKSFFAARQIHMIYNWIDPNKFKEIHDDSIYENYGLDPAKKMVISVSAFWDDNTTRYNDAVRLAKILPEDYQLVIVGKKITQKPLESNMVHIDFVNGTEELSKLYSAALAFVGFSVEDTFGKVFAEAMLCGTPVIVFNSTACPEVVGDVGYAVAPHDVKAMLDKVVEIERNGRDYYSARAKSLVRSQYDYEKNVGQYLKVYENILEKKSISFHA